MIKQMREGMKEEGYSESILKRSELVYRDIAEVRVLFAMRFGNSEPHTAIDVLQLVRSEGRWWIASIVSDILAPGEPVPRRIELENCPPRAAPRMSALFKGGPRRSGSDDDRTGCRGRPHYDLSMGSALLQQRFMGKATAPAPAASRITPSSQEIRLRNSPANSRDDLTRKSEKQQQCRRRGCGTRSSHTSVLPENVSLPTTIVTGDRPSTVVSASPVRFECWENGRHVRFGPVRVVPSAGLARATGTG